MFLPNLGVAQNATSVLRDQTREAQKEAFRQEVKHFTEAYQQQLQQESFARDSVRTLLQKAVTFRLTLAEATEILSQKFPPAIVSQEAENFKPVIPEEGAQIQTGQQDPGAT